MSRLQIAIALSIGLTISADVLACGESMFHSGQAMRYHSFITRQPADILIYRPGATDASGDQRQLYVGLEKAGHKVTLVNDGAGMIRALAAKHFDVVIADAHDMDAVTAQLGKSKRDTALLAVVGDGPEGKQDGERFPRCVREGDGLNQYLKSIEQTMQTRGS